MSFAARAWTLPITAAAASRASDWLIKAWGDRAGDTEFAIDALALARVCSLLQPASTQSLDRLIATVAHGPAPAWGAGNLFPGLIAAGALLRRPNDLARSAGEYVQLLADLESEAAGSNAVLVRLALHGADCIAVAGAGAVDTALDVRPLRSGDRDAAGRLLATIEAVTMFGLIDRPFKNPLAALLEGAAMAALRAYDLPLAMRFLRARLYARTDRSLGLTTGFDFIRLSQCDDGSFGDYDAALARMARRGERDAELRLKLPVALQALWTMAECEDPSFRLVRAAFAGADALLWCGELRDVDERTDRIVQA